MKSRTSGRSIGGGLHVAASDRPRRSARPRPARAPSSTDGRAAGAGRRVSISVRMLGWAPLSDRRAALRAQALREAREVDHQRRVGEAQLREVDDHVARRLQGRGDRSTATPLVVRSSSPDDPEDRQLVVEVNDPRQPIHTAGFVQGRPDLYTRGHGRRRRRHRGPDQRHRPRAGARLRRARPGLRRRDRRRHGQHHVHADHARLPDRSAGLRADAGVRRRARPASRRSSPTWSSRPRGRRRRCPRTRSSPSGYCTPFAVRAPAPSAAAPAARRAPPRSSRRARRGPASRRSRRAGRSPSRRCRT